MYNGFVALSLFLLYYCILVYLVEGHKKKDSLIKAKLLSKNKKKLKKQKKPKQLSEKEIFYNDQEIFKQNLKDEYGIDIDNEEHKSN